MTRLPAWGYILACTTAAALLAVFPARGQASQEIPLGSAMPTPNASLSTVQGGQATLAGLQGGAATVVAFWSNQCPWVDRYEERLLDLVEAYAGQGVSFVLVNSNDPSAYPQESAAESAARFRESGIPSAVTYLSDSGSDLAEAFGAERTPHVFVFDANSALVYVGTIDDSPGDPANVQAQFLRDALDAVVGGSSVTVPQTKAFGCTIKFGG